VGWGEPAQIARTLVGALLRMLRLDLVHVRSNGHTGDAPLEMYRFAQPLPPEIGAAFEQWFGKDGQGLIRQGVAELKSPATVAPGRIRRAGGGRKRAVDSDASFRTDLEKLLESTTRGDPEAPLRWTCKSVRNLTAELNRMKHAVSHQVVADLLHQLGYSLQANSKTKDRARHPDRNQQFEHLNGKVKWCLGRKQPVISVDTKKKELVGDFKNAGRELRPKGDSEKVRVHDFIDKELGRATPYGIPLWHLRYRWQLRLGQCRHRP
jgi:transposase